MFCLIKEETIRKLFSAQYLSMYVSLGFENTVTVCHTLLIVLNTTYMITQNGNVIPGRRSSIEHIT